MLMFPHEKYIVIFRNIKHNKHIIMFMYYQNKKGYLRVCRKYINVFKTIYYIFETMCILFNNDNKILSINYFCRWLSEST